MKTYRQANCHQVRPVAITALEVLEDQVSILSGRRIITPLELQADPEDRAALEALAAHERINQLERQVDPTDQVVLEDLEAQAAQADPEAQVFLVTRMYRQANCPQECPVAQAVQAALEDQEAQVR
jgi:hypothetical protein